MEASLWGRVRNVEILLEANANKQLQDSEGQSALNLAQSTRKNEKQRYNRVEYAAAQDVPDRDSDRRHIVILLDDHPAELSAGYTEPISRGDRSRYSFDKSQAELEITLCGPLQSYKVPRISKTAAILARGSQFQRISATSGWSNEALPLNFKTRPG
jgi:hypothetical protein